MTFSEFIFKVRFRLWDHLVQYTRHKAIYPCLYRSYWHAKFFSGKTTANDTCYYAARPHPGAGIGHQMANWIAGYWFAGQFKLKFAHIPFSAQKWEDFLGFGAGEKGVKELVKSGYKVRRLPVFEEYNPMEVALVKKIITSYAGKKMVFVAEQDQYYMELFGAMDDIKQKFYQAKSRKTDRLIYSKENFNIAIHVRRGDIVIGKETNQPNLRMRWQDNKYFTNVLTEVIKTIPTDQPIAIYLFSQGTTNDFQDFNHFKNISFCLDMSAPDSFLHMVYADLLITSKSSFSYKPALLNNGIKICPRDFWHGYPHTNDWILADERGYFDRVILNSIIPTI